MQAVIFMGLQASGKSSFYRDRFFKTHLLISLDQIRTRHRESQLLSVCLETNQRFVIDNTNPRRDDRQRYLPAAKKARFETVGYYFRSSIEECLARNSSRETRIPEPAILRTASNLERPTPEEGFDQLFHVHISESGFVVKEWEDEI